LQLFNFYLPAHAHRDKRAPLQALLRMRPPVNGMYTIAMGDFNFIEHPDDHSPPSPSLLLDRQTQRLWQHITEKFDLSELPQPIHTYYHGTE
jgi:hypothetical protein